MSRLRQEGCKDDQPFVQHALRECQPPFSPRTCTTEPPFPETLQRHNRGGESGRRAPLFPAGEWTQGIQPRHGRLPRGMLPRAGTVATPCTRGQCIQQRQGFRSGHLIDVSSAVEVVWRWWYGLCSCIAKTVFLLLLRRQKVRCDAVWRDGGVGVSGGSGLQLPQRQTAETKTHEPSTPRPLQRVPTKKTRLGLQKRWTALQITTWVVPVGPHPHQMQTTEYRKGVDN